MDKIVTIRTDLGEGRALMLDVPVEEIARQAEFLESFDAKGEAERLRAMLPARVMSHEWKSHKNPDTPDGPGEWIEYCDNCGVESDDDNRDGECEPQEDDESIVAPILPPYEG